MTKVFPLCIKDHREMTWCIAVSDALQHVDETENGVRRKPFGSGQLFHRIKGAVDVGLPIDKKHLHLSIHHAATVSGSHRGVKRLTIHH